MEGIKTTKFADWRLDFRAFAVKNSKATGLRIWQRQKNPRHTDVCLETVQ